MAEGIQIKNLPSTTTIKQGDTMTIVQDKQNKQLSLDVFANESDLGTLSPLENRCDEVKAKIEVDEYSAEITTSQSMSKIGTDDSGANLHENVLDGAFELCVLKGHTKYRDIDTGEILENFEESRNLELITVRMPILTTVGKNLFDGILKQGYLADATGESVSQLGLHSTNYMKCSPNSIYTISGTLNSLTPRFYFYDSDKKYLGNDIGINNYKTYTAPLNACYMRFRLYSQEQCDITLFNAIQVEESSIATSYEPYKSSILSCNEEVELRGIGDVRDTLDLMTGELTERIKKFDFLATDDGNWYYHKNENGYISYYMSNKALTIKNNGICDKLPICSWSNEASYMNKECIWEHGASSWGVILKSDRATTKQEFLNYLNDNVELLLISKTESIKTVGLSGYPFSYENGHVILSSGSTEPSLTPTVTYKVPVSRVGQIASNTKSNLRQTIKLDQLEILAYQSLINAEYENLLVQNSAESAASFTNLSTNDPKDELYYMLKHLIEEDQPVQNMLDKINLFYLYGLLNDEHYFDLLLGGEEDVY